LYTFLISPLASSSI